MIGVNVYHLAPPSPNPVQLADFKYSIEGSGVVELHWTTLSETNNYGFEVQKSVNRSEGFVSVSGLISGQGTTLEKHEYFFSDLSGGEGRFYRLKQIDLDGVVHYSEALEVGTTGVSEEKVTKFALDQNYPNPFNPTTSIRFSLPYRCDVTVKVFNALGQEVIQLVSGNQEAGVHEVRFDGSGLSSGVYLYRLQASDFVETHKLLLIR